MVLSTTKLVTFNCMHIRTFKFEIDIIYVCYLHFMHHTCRTFKPFIDYIFASFFKSQFLVVVFPSRMGLYVYPVLVLSDSDTFFLGA